MTLPKGYKRSRFSRKNFRRIMYYPTPREYCFGMGFAFSMLSILTFHTPSDHSLRILGRLVISLSSATGVPQYIIWMLPALFFFGLVTYDKLSFRKALPSEITRSRNRLIKLKIYSILMGVLILIYLFFGSYAIPSHIDGVSLTPLQIVVLIVPFLMIGLLMLFRKYMFRK